MGDIIRDYLLKGYSIDSSCAVVTQENYLNLVNVVNRIDSKQKKEIILIDNYTDKFTLDMLRNKRDKAVSIAIITTF